MTHVYEKTTKETVDFPVYVLSFLMAIMNKLKAYGLIGENQKKKEDIPDKITIPIVSKRFKYCYDGIKLIKKTIGRRGFTCELKRFKSESIKDAEGKTCPGYTYEYEISKKKD